MPSLPRATPRRGWSVLPAAGFLILVSWFGSPLAHPSRQVLRDSLLGTAGDDVLRGTPRNDLLEGKGGDDRLIGLEGNDVLSGGAGRDVLQGGPGDDVLGGGDDPDWLMGGDGRDWLFGDAGDDQLDGGEGPDALDGGDGNDRLQGANGDDAIDGNTGDDVLEGGAGKDRLDGGDGIDLLDGGDGPDVLDGGDENDVLRGGPGVDSLSGADGDDNLEGGADPDVLQGGDGDDVLKGGPGNDKLAGGDGNDQIDGAAGEDLLNGGEGDDILTGLAGADTLLGHHGTDRLSGGVGNDLLHGGDGTDILDGDDGDDRLTGGAAADLIRGGAGNDLILLRAGDIDSSATELIDGGTNRDTTRVEADSLVLSGFAGARIARLSTGQLEIIDPITGGRYLVSRVERIAYLELVPYLAGGESLLQVVGAGAEPVEGRVELLDAAGKALLAGRSGDSSVAALPLRIPARGSAELVLHAPVDGQLRVYVNHPVALALRTTLPGGSGRGLVPASRFRDEFSVPLVLDRAQGTSTSIAVTTGVVGTTLQLWVTNAAGQEIENANVDIPPRGSVVRNALDLFPRLNRFEGRLAVAAGQIGAVAFQMRDGRAIPAGVSRWESPVTPGPRQLPYLLTGGGHRFTVIVAGYDSVTGGRVAFLDPAGRPLAVDVAGVGNVNEVPFRFGLRGTLYITTTGGGPLTSATARITTERGTVTATSWVTLERDGPVEIPGSRGVSGFVAPLRLSAGNGSGATLALSAGPSPVTVTLALTDESGRRVAGGEAQVRIPANGQVVRTLREHFPRARLTGFRGSLLATAGQDRVVAALVERGGGTAALIPLTPVSPP